MRRVSEPVPCVGPLIGQAVSILASHWLKRPRPCVSSLGREGGTAERASKLMAWIWIMDSSLERNSSSSSRPAHPPHFLSLTLSVQILLTRRCSIAPGILNRTSNPCKIIKSCPRSVLLLTPPRRPDVSVWTVINCIP